MCFTSDLFPVLSFELVLEMQRTAQGPTDFLDILINQAAAKLEKKFVLKRAFTQMYELQKCHSSNGGHLTSNCSAGLSS